MPLETIHMVLWVSLRELEGPLASSVRCFFLLAVEESSIAVDSGHGSDIRSDRVGCSQYKTNKRCSEWCRRCMRSRFPGWDTWYVLTDTLFPGVVLLTMSSSFYSYGHWLMRHSWGCDGDIRLLWTTCGRARNNKGGKTETILQATSKGPCRDGIKMCAVRDTTYIGRYVVPTTRFCT